MTLRLSILLIGILFLSSCGEMFDSGEIITSDYEPELNVYGFISFDNLEPSFVYVHRTLSLDENPNDYSSYFVNDAEVFIIDASGTSNPFSEIDNNPYYWEPDGFIPQFDADYTLEVTDVQNGMSLTGALHTPVKPELLMYPDSIQSDSFFTIRWNSTGNSMVHIEVESWEQGCYIHQSEYFENGETEWTTRIFSCIDNYYGYYSENPDSLSINLTFMDINYYNYFVKNDEDEFLNFLMGMSGSTQYAFGVEGGLGVFGSYATDVVILPFDP